MAKRKKVKNVFGDDIGFLDSFSERERRILQNRRKKRQIIIE